MARVSDDALPVEPRSSTIAITDGRAARMGRNQQPAARAASTESLSTGKIGPVILVSAYGQHPPTLTVQ